MGRGAGRRGGLRNFQSKNTRQWQCPNELPILSLPHERVQQLPPYCAEGSKVSAVQCTICETIFSLRQCHSHGYNKSICQFVLTEALLGVQ